MAVDQYANKLRSTANAKRVFLLVFSIFIAVGIGCSASNGQGQPTPSAQNVTLKTTAIVWGKADLEPTDAINKWQPTVDYLAANLNGVGIDVGRIKIAPDSATLAQWMAEGKVDIAQDSYYPAMVINDGAGAVPVAIRERGKPEKHAVFFVRSDSSINSLSDLGGETVAFAEPDSTSGFMLPMVHLREQGLRPIETKSSVGSNQIGYQFAGDDDVVAYWVLTGDVMAGAVDNKTFDEFAEANPGRLTILSETPSISSNNVVLVRKDLDPVLVQAIKTALFEMSDTEEGLKVLKGTKTVKYNNFDDRGDAYWSSTKEQYLLIKD